MTNKEIFSQYALENNIQKSIVTEFNKIEKNIEESDTLNSVSSFKLINVFIENFGNIESKEIDFTEKTLSILGEPGIGKTATIEAIIFAIFGQNKTLKQVNSVNDDRTKTSVTISIGKYKYKIDRSIKRGTSTCCIYMNEESNPIEIGGIKEANEYIETILGVSYDMFVELFYSGDLSNSLTSKKQIEIKQLFVNLVDADYWKEIHDIALEKQRDTERELAKLDGADDVIKRISDGSSTEDLKEELKEINKTIPDLNKEIKSISINKDSSKELSNIAKKIIDLKRVSVNEDDLSEKIANNTLKIQILLRDGKKLYEDIITNQNINMNNTSTLNNVKSEGKRIANIIESAKSGICPIMKSSCKTIVDSVSKYEEEKDALKKTYIETNKTNKEVEEKILVLIKEFEDITSFKFNENKDFIDDVVTSLEKENETLGNNISSGKDACKKLESEEKKYSAIQKEIEKSSELLEEKSSLLTQLSELKSRKTTIENILSEISGVDDKAKKRKSLTKKLNTYKTISDATQRNKIPKTEALSWKKKVESKIKSFCNDILPFKKYEFDNQFVLYIDGKPATILNSATKKIVDLAFRTAMSSIYVRKLPIYIIDDIGDSCPDALTNTLIEKIKNINVSLFIYTSNREGVSNGK